ncbi:MAG: hypothetical protein ACI9F2_000648 [Lysobacterales bacterium]|jgi:hypothetical protein
MSEGKCCNKIMIIAVLLLALNTFFVGSMWCKMMRCGGTSSKMCLFKSDKSPKICPLTGKVLNAKGSSAEVK